MHPHARAVSKNLGTIRSQPNILSSLAARIEAAPEEQTYTFFDRGDPRGPSSSRSNLGLHERASAIATHLRQRLEPGDRALLLFAPGLDFIDAFFGCLYAGVVAVPAYPPDPVRLQHTLPRLVAIARSAEVSVVLTQRFVQDLQRSMPELPATLTRIPWIAVDEISAEASVRELPQPASPDDLAFIQYTSGSTGAPRGVMVSHGNLFTNALMAGEGMSANPWDVVASWLPLFHDMGLIGGVLSPLIRGMRSYLMSPLDFLARPLRWLRMISDVGATHSGGPNFAYGLCARRATPQAVEGLDLSGWRVAFNGAEPVDADGLERFTKTFAPVGFRPEALFPTYGLAEATLFVSGGPAGSGTVVQRCSAGLLERDIVDPDPKGVAQVASGRVPGDSVRIVADGQPLGPRRVGEIWVRGGHVARGYWGEAEATAATFEQRLPDGSSGWMRTGDLGFLDEGLLYVSGRVKDLIIVNGRNIHPHDVERIAERAHPSARPGGYAAFGVPGRHGEVVVLLAETTLTGAAQQELIDATRRRIGAELDIVLHDVVALPKRTLPKTSSGKIQRRACRALYLERYAEQPVVPESPATAPPDDTSSSATYELLVQSLVARKGISASSLGPETTLHELGVDSIDAAELVVRLQERVGRRIDLQGLGGATLREIARRIDEDPDGSESLPGSARLDWRKRDLSHFQGATGTDLFEIHEHYARWSKDAQPGGYELYDQHLTSAPAASVDLSGSSDALVNLASYNYLGLSTRPEVADAAAAAVRHFGLSASGSPLLSGLLSVHDELERALADFKQVEAMLLFPTGYATNVGVISALAGPGDVVIADAFAHASIVDGVSLAHARMVYFRHNDMRHLERALKRAKGRSLVAVEGVYSMDGDLAPLPDVVELCRRYGARLLVDEAHSAFVFGAHGRGAVEHFGVEEHVDVHIGTLSKSLGGMGGYVGGSRTLIDYVKAYARARTFSCALSPPVAAGLLAALRVLEREPELRDRLWHNVGIMRESLVAQGVDIGATESQVIPVLINDDDRIFEVTRRLIERGIYLNPVRYPAVRQNQARFRISVSAVHEPRELQRAAEIIGDVLREQGIGQ